MSYIRCFLKGCQICHLHKVGPTPQRQFENRTNKLPSNHPLYRGTLHEVGIALIHNVYCKHGPLLI